MNQKSFDFDGPPKITTNAPAEEKPRLGRQAEIIYEMLQDGPVSNVALAQTALKYTSRISDIRKFLINHQIPKRIEVERLGGGVNLYHLRDIKNNG